MPARRWALRPACPVGVYLEPSWGGARAFRALDGHAPNQRLRKPHISMAFCLAHHSSLTLRPESVLPPSLQCCQCLSPTLHAGSPASSLDTGPFSSHQNFLSSDISFLLPDKLAFPSMCHPQGSHASSSLSSQDVTASPKSLSLFLYRALHPHRHTAGQAAQKHISLLPPCSLPPLPFGNGVPLGFSCLSTS